MTSKESFAAYEAVLAEKDPREEEHLRNWRNADEKEKHKIVTEQLKWKDEHDERVMQAIKDLVPEVGTPCTIVYYSDKRAATVSRIISDRKIAVRHNQTECLDYYAGNYKILPELEEKEDIFTKRKNGFWCMEGQSTKDGVLLMLHYQRHYIDPSF